MKKIITNQQEYVIFGTAIILNMNVIVIGVKHYKFKNILFKIRPQLKGIINKLNKSDTRKILLAIAINFVFKRQ